MKKSVIVFSTLLLFSCSQSKSGKPNMENLGNDSITQVENNRIAVLNELRNELLLTYGTIDGWSRVDMGPCGEFAYAFYEEWNSRFKDSVNIVFKTNRQQFLAVTVTLTLSGENRFKNAPGK